MKYEDAEEFTQSLAQIFAGSWRQILWAQQQGIPKALGLTTEQWTKDRLGGYVSLAIEERREAVREMKAQGMSTRQIAGVLGKDQKTIVNDLHAEEKSSVEESFVLELPAHTEEKSSPKKSAHVANNSGDNEWYTPVHYITSARTVMGDIDLDPASSEIANQVVEAKRFYTIDDDGLAQPWRGRVWMNPPYSQPLVDNFCARLARSYSGGDVVEACALVNNATETVWFQSLACLASAICFPRGRVKFWHPSKEAVPLQGQAVIYLGVNVEDFKSEFLRFGLVMEVKNNGGRT